MNTQSGRTTAPDLLAIQQQLIDREPIFHRPELGTQRSDFEAMMAEDFREIGASGRCYDKAFVLDMLEQRHAEPHIDRWKTSNFLCQRLAPELYLLTYTLQQDERVTRRATVWRRAARGWLIVYHQGTIVATM